MMEQETPVAFVRVLVEMINSICINKRSTTFDAMNFVAFVQQKLCQIGTVLPSDAGDKSSFHIFC